MPELHGLASRGNKSIEIPVANVTHHHVVLHQLGWTLTAHPDGTSQVRNPQWQDHLQPQPAALRVTGSPGRNRVVLLQPVRGAG